MRPATRNVRLASLAVLVLAIAAAWIGVRRDAFVPLDDDLYVYANPHVRAGLAWPTAAWALRSGEAANWHPITWMSHALDWQLFGANAGAHHLVSLVLHALSSVLLATLLFRWTRDWWPSLFVAGVFALHPQHVESVAWAAERKDVLSHLFLVLALHAWTSWIERATAARYALSLVLYALGLASKPMLVTLPFLMLVLDVWPLRRFAWKRSLVEKAPFFALATASCVVTYLVQREGGAMRGTEALSLGARLANAAVAYPRYVGKAFWPAELSVLHPYRAWSAWQVAASIALLAMLVAWAIAGRRERGWRFAGIAWFLGTLVPVIGVVQVGFQSIANRYAYVPMTGLAIAIAWELASYARTRGLERALAITGALVLALLAWRTHVEIEHWRDGETLFTRALEIDPDNHVARRLLGDALLEQGRVEEARAQQEQANEVTRGQAEALHRQGVLLCANGELERGIALLRQAVRIAPKLVAPHYDLGLALIGSKHEAEGVAELETALRLDPSHVGAHGNLGRVELARGAFAKAIEHFRAALAGRPDDPRVAEALALALLEAGESGEALQRFGAILRASPESRERARAALRHAADRARANGDADRARALEATAEHELGP